MSRPLHFTLAFLTSTIFSVAPATAQSIAPGMTQTVPVISVSLNVGNMEKETRRVIYAPPPGWHIRSHRVECTTKTGLASYTVNTVPADWAWFFEDAASEAGNGKASAAALVHGIGGQAAGQSESRKVSAEHQRTTASHHALVVEATARGSGFLGKGAGLELTVYAELVYVGPENPAPRPPLLKGPTSAKLSRPLSNDDRKKP